MKQFKVIKYLMSIIRVIKIQKLWSHVRENHLNNSIAYIILVVNLDDEDATISTCASPTVYKPKFQGKTLINQNDQRII